MKEIERYYEMPDPMHHAIFYDCHFDEEWHTIGLQRHDAWEVMYIPSGHGIRIIDGMEAPFRKGEVILLPPSVPHCWKYVRDEQDKPQHIMVAFTQQTLLQAMSVFPELQRILAGVAFPSSARLLFGTRNIRKTLRDMAGKDSYTQLLMFLGILPQLFTGRSKPVSGRRLKDDRNKQKVVAVKSYIYKYFPTRIALADVAAEVGMNRTSFCRFFKEQTGETFYDYLTGFRLDMACHMLQHTDRGIEEICYAVGFNDTPHFNRTFKRFKGVTPKQFRTSTNPPPDVHPPCFQSETRP